MLQQVFGIEHHTLTLVGEIGNAESCDCCLSIIAGCLVQFVRSQHQMTHIQEGGFIVGNRPAEGAERSHQDFNAIEIGTHMAEYAMQLALDSIYGRPVSYTHLDVYKRQGKAEAGTVQADRSMIGVVDC